MSAHETRVIPHDRVNCHTARHAEDGDCGTRFMVHCSCGFGQGASSREHADAIAKGHAADPDQPVVAWHVSDAQLRDLFARHCECRPLNPARGEHDHSHDCDTAILRDVQVALSITLFNVAHPHARDEARARCKEHLAMVPNGLGGYEQPRKDP